VEVFDMGEFSDAFMELTGQRPGDVKRCKWYEKPIMWSLQIVMCGSLLIMASGMIIGPVFMIKRLFGGW
jgi:hypothetical protein